MTWQAWTVLGATLGSLVAMASGWAAAEVAIGVALGAVMLLGIVTPAQALAGFGNEQLHTVAILFVIAAALRAAGSLGVVTGRLFVTTNSLTSALLRLTIPVSLFSAVLNNTPIVALLIPEVRSWARRCGIAASRLLIPLSFATVAGGLITVIGTSTNLVVNGLLTQTGRTPIGFAEIGLVGLPIAVVTVVYLTVVAKWLLPDRPDVDAAFSNPQTFTTEILIDRGGPCEGKRLADIRVQDLPALAPVEIQRAGVVIPAPRPDHVLQAGDRLVFAGPVAALLALRGHPGLQVAPDHAFDRSSPHRQIAELLISPRCPLIGRRVGDGTFRQRYNAAVIAVARHGERVDNARLGDWELQSGDIVLVEAGSDFFERHRANPDFYLVTPHGAPPAASSTRAWFGLGILVAMVGAAAFEIVPMFQATVIAIAVLVVTGFVTRDRVREGLDPSTLLVIALSFGLGTALERSGAVGGFSMLVERFGNSDPMVGLVLVYLVTAAVTEVITNNAAAALMMPVGFAVAGGLGVSYVPYAVAVMVAASASFVTPIGYQTNLMVYGAGGYRFSDFPRIGLPLTILVAIVTLTLIPVFWPF